jgi:hypothetical protein
MRQLYILIIMNMTTVRVFDFIYVKHNVVTFPTTGNCAHKWTIKLFSHSYIVLASLTIQSETYEER